MSKIEVIALSIMVALTVVTAFDFIIYLIKSAPKSMFFTKKVAIIGFICFVALIYWFMNGKQFM